MAQEVFDELTGQEDDCGAAFYEALEAVRAGTPRLDALFPVEASS
ncbi:hypothetical protein ABZ946_28720 [Streptomyces sp. NPDC046324]